MRKKSWLVGLGQEGLKCWGNCLAYLERGKNTKEWRGDKDFKKEGGNLGQDVGSKGSGPPFRTMLRT